MNVIKHFRTFTIISGIIESDDIQIITTEVDKALNFSRKCQMLIDNVKKKYRQRYVSVMIMVWEDFCCHIYPKIWTKNMVTTLIY